MSRPALRTEFCDRVGIEYPVGWCGSVFLVSEEANQPDLQKQRILDAAAEDTRVTRLDSGKTMRNISNPLIEAWEREGLMALPMGAQGMLIRDLIHSVKETGRHELSMNAAGQPAGTLRKKRPAAEILEEMVADATLILGSELSKRAALALDCDQKPRHVTKARTHSGERSLHRRVADGDCHCDGRRRQAGTGCGSGASADGASRLV